MLKALKQQTNAFFYSLEGLVGDTHCCSCADRLEVDESIQIISLDGRAPAPEQLARPLSSPCHAKPGDYDGNMWMAPCSLGPEGQVHVDDVQNVTMPVGAEWVALPAQGQPGADSRWQASGAGSPSSWSIASSSRSRMREEVEGKEFRGHSHLKSFYSKQQVDSRGGEQKKRAEPADDQSESSGEERERSKELDSCKEGLCDMLKKHKHELPHGDQEEVGKILEALGGAQLTDRRSMKRNSSTRALIGRQSSHLRQFGSSASLAIPDVIGLTLPNSEASAKQSGLTRAMSSASTGELSTEEDESPEGELQGRWEEERRRNDHKIDKILSSEEVPREDWGKRERLKLRAKVHKHEPRQTEFEKEEQKDIEAFQEAVAYRMASAGLESYTPKPAEDRAAAVVNSILHQYKQVRTERELFATDDDCESDDNALNIEAETLSKRRLQMEVDLLEDDTGMGKELPPHRSACIA